MIRYLFLALAIILLAGCGETAEQQGELILAENTQADGRWQVINYWAIWCHPCREEIPELNALAANHGEEIAVYGVNYDGVEGEQLVSQARELGINFVQLTQDPAERLSYARPTVLPTTLIVDPQGNITTRLIGPQTALSLLRGIKEASEL